MLPDDPALAVLDLFTTDLAHVQFPDMSREVLETAASDVSLALEELGAAEALLEHAHQKLLARQGELAQKAARALAYAKVYAETDALLFARVTAIADLPGLAPRAPRKVVEGPNAPAARRRGRPPKTATGQASLGALAAETLGVDEAAAAE